MTPFLLAILLSAQTPAQDTVLPARFAASAYLDEGARELVRRARERQRTTGREILEYQTLARERISLGFQTLGRERLFFRRELAARVHWRRDAPGTIEVLGARQVLPALTARVAVPRSELSGETAGLAFDPAGDDFFDQLVSGGRGDRAQAGSGGWFKHPLALGSEEHYRFRSGDTTDIRLQDGGRVRLFELHVLPRRRDAQLLHGSVWLDAATYAPVRIVMRMARPFDLDLDGRRMGDDDDDSDVPRLLKPIRADMRLLTIEYALWRDEAAGDAGGWWLPRLLAVDGLAEVNLLPDFPIRFERVYSDLRVVAAPAGAGSDTLATPAVLTQCPGRPRRSRERRRADEADAAADTESGAGHLAIGPGGADAAVVRTAASDSAGLTCTCNRGVCRLYEVQVPEDTASLIASEFLPPSPFATGELLVSGEQITTLAEQLRTLSPMPWGVQPPLLTWTYLSGDLIRYNRVEGLSLGVRAGADFGAFDAAATARLGFADLRPGGELRLARSGHLQRVGLGAYRRLLPVDPTTRPLGPGNSLNAALFGIDDGYYYRAWGVELAGEPAPGRPRRYGWRVFAERQSQAQQETDWSVAHLIDAEHGFAPNLVADSADQVGAALALRTARGLDPAGVRTAVELEVEAATGTFAYVRPALTASLAAPLPGRLRGVLELAGGTSAGELPQQRAWLLGGMGSVRGYAGGAAAGDAFWRGRAEVASALPGARLVLFSDAGSAAPRAELPLDPMLLSAGAGVSLLDGLVRFDLARALRGATGWRFGIYVDGRL